MEKETQARCPNCENFTLNIYYDDGGIVPLAAICDACAFEGCYIKGELEALPAEDSTADASQIGFSTQDLAS